MNKSMEYYEGIGAKLYGLNRLSAVEWFWTMGDAETLLSASGSQSPFGCGVVLDRKLAGHD